MHISRQTGWLAGDPGDASVVAIPSIRTVPLEVACRLFGLASHWTASRGQTSRHIGELAKGIVEGSGPSWHFLAGRFGNIVQSVSVHRGANHVGRFAEIDGKNRSVNRTLAGLEIENLGMVMRIGPEWRQVRNPQDPPHLHAPSDFVCPDAEVVHDDAGSWHDFTPAQIAAVESLIRALVARFGWRREACEYSHAAFDPGRKCDPGPVWMKVHLPAILDRVFP